MDFILMLTRNDRTVEDGLYILDIIKDFSIKHVGFKDIGVNHQELGGLVEGIRQLGATSYFEVVSTTRDAARESIRTAFGLGVDRVLGGQDIEFALDLLRGSRTEYFPFPGKPTGHPTRLGGSPEDIVEDCRRMRAAGCAGADLLAYRATDADPLALVHAARGALADGYLIVAGSVNSPQQIRELKDAGADAFTMGSAVFDGSFSPSKGATQSQLRDVLAACEAVA